MIAKDKRNVLSSQKSKLVLKMARKVKISIQNIFRIIKYDQALKVFKKVRVWALTSGQIGKGKSISDWIKNYYKKLTCQHLVFSQKWFYQDDMLTKNKYY